MTVEAPVREKRIALDSLPAKQQRRIAEQIADSAERERVITYLDRRDKAAREQRKVKRVAKRNARKHNRPKRHRVKT